MSNLQVFAYEGNDIRTIEQDGMLWWVLVDVCKALDIANRKHVVERLDQDEVRQTYLIDSLGRQQKAIIVNESGLYSVILRSDKPEAVPFRRWVTHDVLPSIRKHGAYLTDAAIEKALSDPDTVIRLATQLKDERQARKQLEVENAAQQRRIAELQPKATYVDTILDNKGLVTITQIAKDYGMSGMAMNRKLRELGIQYRQSGQWLLYSKYHGHGCVSSKTIQITRRDGCPDITMETLWTQKGRLFVYNQLKSLGIIPLIEKETPA